MSPEPINAASDLFAASRQESATTGLELRDLCWSAPAAGNRPIRVLDGISLRLQDGKLNALIGPSGCGKSSLGYLIAGFLRADSGEIRLDGQPVDGPGPDRLMVFQESSLWPWMTVRDNVMFGPLARQSLSRAEAEHQAEDLLARFGLARFSGMYPAQLSGGMKRRVDIAQALINRPRLLILDEPFRGLDVMTRELMQEYYLQVCEDSQLTTLLITSDVEEGIFLGDHIFIMGSSGRILRRIDIDLPRPRREAVMATERFQSYQSEVLKAVQDASATAPSQFDP